MTTSPARSTTPPRIRPRRPRAELLALAVLFGLLLALYEIASRMLPVSPGANDGVPLRLIVRGVLSSFALVTFVAWYVMRVGVPVFPPSQEPEATIPDSAERWRQHARWFVHARWVAIGIIFGIIVISGPFARMLPPVTLLPLLLWWSALPIANLGFEWSVARVRSPERHVMVQAVADLVVLTGLLNASGGLENPLYISYLFHVILGAIILPRRQSLVITGVAVGLFLALVIGEAAEILPHYTNRLFPHTRVAESGDVEPHSHRGAEMHHASHDPIFVSGEAGSFVVVLLMAAWLAMLVAERLRHSEERLERTARAAVLERRRLESVVHAAQVGIIVLDPDLTVRWFSQLVSEWWGWDAAAIGQPCPLYRSRNGESAGPAAQVLATGRPAESERGESGADGSVRRFRHVASPVRDAAGKLVQIVEVVEDVTVHRALEAEALHADKMSVLGRMAAGIAHEIGNPLSSMATRLRLMEDRRDPDYLQVSLRLLQRQVHRIGRIVHGVSEFARTPRQEWLTWEVNEAVEEAMGVAELDSRVKGIAFRRAMETPSPRVRGVRDQVVQVVLNLLLNAAESMSGSGTIVVETSRRPGEVAIAVQDSGQGMSDQVRARLFEPFFTTKPQGVGLGLSISYTLIHGHGGRFEVESEPGRGTRVTVLLPAREMAAAARDGA